MKWRVFWEWVNIALRLIPFVNFSKHLTQFTQVKRWAANNTAPWSSVWCRGLVQAYLSGAIGSHAIQTHNLPDQLIWGLLWGSWDRRRSFSWSSKQTMLWAWCPWFELCTWRSNTALNEGTDASVVLLSPHHLPLKMRIVAWGFPICLSAPFNRLQ